MASKDEQSQPRIHTNNFYNYCKKLDQVIYRMEHASIKEKKKKKSLHAIPVVTLDM